MNALKQLQAAIRKFLGLVTPPSEPRAPGTPGRRGKPAANLTLQGLTKAEADRAAAAIQADIEKALGHPVTMIHLGHVKVKLVEPCDCRECQRRKKAQWN